MTEHFVSKEPEYKNYNVKEGKGERAGGRMRQTKTGTSLGPLQLNT